MTIRDSQSEWYQQKHTINYDNNNKHNKKIAIICLN